MISHTSVMPHKNVTKVVMTMVTGVGGLAAGFSLLACDHWSATVDPSWTSPSEVSFRRELPAGLSLRFEDDRTAQ